MTTATDDPRTSSLLDASAHAVVRGDTQHALRMAQAAWNDAPHAHAARAAAARLALLAGYAGDVLAAHQWGDEASGAQGPSAQSDLAVARCIAAVEQQGEPQELSPAHLRDARRLWPVAYWAQGRFELRSGNPLRAVELVRSAEFLSQSSGQARFGRHLLRVLHAEAAWDMGDAARARHALQDVPAGCAAAVGVRVRLALAIDGATEARRQSFELAAQCTELRNLPGDYVAPSGGLFLARANGQAAGCCAFRPLITSDHLDACEMKRLFVRPGFRGLGLGRQLVDLVVLSAQQAGYTTMLLDTLSDMEAARALYQEVGFTETEPYYHNPLAGAHYLKLDLRAFAPGAA